MTRHLAFDRGGHQLPDRDRLADGPDAVTLGVNEDDQILDQSIEPVGLGADVLRERLTTVRGQIALRQQLRTAVDRGHGRAQLMGQDVEECLAIAQRQRSCRRLAQDRSRGWGGGVTARTRFFAPAARASSGRSTSWRHRAAARGPASSVPTVGVLRKRRADPQAGPPHGAALQPSCKVPGPAKRGSHASPPTVVEAHATPAMRRPHEVFACPVHARGRARCRRLQLLPRLRHRPTRGPDRHLVPRTAPLRLSPETRPEASPSDAAPSAS